MLAFAAPQKLAWMEAGCPRPAWVCQTCSDGLRAGRLHHPISILLSWRPRHFERPPPEGSISGNRRGTQKGELATVAVGGSQEIGPLKWDGSILPWQLEPPEMGPLKISSGIMEKTMDGEWQLRYIPSEWQLWSCDGGGIGMKPGERIIVALDVDNKQHAMNLVRALRGKVGFFKVGSQLFTAEGPELVREILRLDERIFLDLKFHDIPNTVAKAVGVACSMGISMLTLHAHGGSKMMRAAAESLRMAGGAGLTLLGVTVLTSLGEDDLREVGIGSQVSEQVNHLGLLAKQSGLKGLVASPQEVAGLRSLLGPEMVLVTPGIRPAGGNINDQNRIATPSAAFAAGADYLVVGRPITAATDPLEGLQRIIEEIQAGADSVNEDA